MSILSLLSICVVVLSEDRSSEVPLPNPHVAKAVDPALKKEFEYLVFDLGKGVELKLVKIPAKGKTFTIGTTREEQEKVLVCCLYPLYAL